MANDVNDPQVLRASDTVDGQSDTADSTVVRETRPSAVPVSQTTSDPAATYADRHAALNERYGGFYWGSDFIGFAVAMFFMLVFLGIVGAIVGAVGFQLHAPVPHIGGAISNTTQSLGIGALVGSLIAVLLAFVIGGYTAGRMARFAGAKNGFGVWLWTVVVAIILGVVGAILGNRFNVANQIHLGINRQTLTTGGAVSIGVTLLVMLIGALLGGIMGERYHRHIDQDAETLA